MEFGKRKRYDMGSEKVEMDKSPSISVQENISPSPKKNESKDMTTNVSNIRLFLIAVGSFVMYFCSWGMAQSFGIMFIELLDKFDGSKAETTWVSSLFSGVLLVSGPIAGILLKKYNCRIVGIIGSLILTVGLVSSVFTPSLHVLYVTYGVVGGFGGSLLFTTAGVVVLQQFDRWKSLVLGLSESGAAVGTIVIPLMTQACLDEYGFRGTFLLLGGLGLQCLVVSLLFVPPRSSKGTDFIDSNENEMDEDNSNPTKQDKKTRTERFKNMFAFMNVGYSLFAISWAVMMLPFLVPFLFLPDAALSDGATKQEAALIASALGVGSVVGKVTFGFFGDVKRIETLILHIIPIILFGTLTLLYNFVSGFTNFMILAALIGMTSAICDGMHPVITFQLVGVKHCSLGLGVLYFLMSFTTILGAPIAGWIADATGRYAETFYYCTGLSYLAALSAAYIPFWKRTHKPVDDNNISISYIYDGNSG